MAWQFDTAHSSIEFSAKHMMLTTVRGRFDKWSGTIELDEQHPERSQVEVTVEADSLDTNQAQRDGHLKSGDFLEVDTYPTITFKSTKVEPLGESKARIYGDLTIHGVTQQAVLEASLEGRTRDMQGNRRLGFSVTGVLSRKNWGLNWNVALEAGGWLVSDRIDIQVETQVVQTADAEAAAKAS